MSIIAERFVPTIPEFAPPWFRVVLEGCFLIKASHRPSAEDILGEFNASHQQ